MPIQKDRVKKCFRVARQSLMPPFPHGIDEAIQNALRECLEGLAEFPDENQIPSAVQQQAKRLKHLHSAPGNFSDDKKEEISDLVDELADWFLVHY